MKAASLEANGQEKAGRQDVGRDKSPRRTDESLESKEDTGESRAQKTAGKAQKSNREKTKDEKRDRIAKLREKNNDAKLKSQPTTKKVATQELENRCAKIEDFLQDRFNWRNYEKPTPKKKSPAPARAEKKSDRFNYMVNMAEKPQDPGTVNELCMEREQKAKARALKAIKNPTTVCQLEKYTELNSNPVKLVPLSTLENGKIMAHMENQIQLLENQQYTRKDDLTQRYVYLYDQERKLQTGGQASKTSASRHRYNLSHDNK